MPSRHRALSSPRSLVTLLKGATDARTGSSPPLQDSTITSPLQARLIARRAPPAWTASALLGTHSPACESFVGTIAWHPTRGSNLLTLAIANHPSQESKHSARGLILGLLLLSSTPSTNHRHAAPPMLCLLLPLTRLSLSHRRHITLTLILILTIQASTSIDVRRCPDSRSECGVRDRTGALTCSEIGSACFGTADPNSTEGSSRSAGELPSAIGCREGLVGVFCQLCDRSNVSVEIYFSPASSGKPAQCKRCRDLISQFVAAYIAIAAVLVLLLFVLVPFCLHRLSARRREQFHCAWVNCTPLTKGKIVISFYLIVSDFNNAHGWGSNDPRLPPVP